MTDGKIDTDDLIAQNPILRTLESRYSMTFKKEGGEYYALCPFHKDGKRGNLRITESKGLWYCDICRVGGSVINFVMRKEGLDFVRACEQLGAHVKQPEPPRDFSNKIPVATYDYYDQLGFLVYQVCRFQFPNPDKSCGYDKTFQQRRPDDNGGWIWNMKDVERIPYRVQEIIKNAESVVNILEGEKDCDTLFALGFVATTNVGGAMKWLDAYGDFLEGREVAIWPDKDKAGAEHAEDVCKKLATKAKSIRMIAIPDPHKDATEWLNAIPDEAEARAAVLALVEQATVLYGGEDVPVFSMAELEIGYRNQARQSGTSILNFARWLPSLQGAVRGILPGELAVFLAATGVGKTALLQNLALIAFPLTTLLFEMELPAELTFERFAAAATKVKCEEVFANYSSGFDFDWRSGAPTDHVFVCSKSALTVLEMERIILKSELKIGRKPVLVLIDYIQLVNSTGKSRYERTSEVAEKLKQVAKRTNTIIFLASQISRPDDDRKDPSVSLYDGKDSGSIENSSGLVIGAWREPGYPQWMKLKVLKNTKGRPGQVVNCNFYGSSMVITEMPKGTEPDREKIDREDVPQPEPAQKYQPQEYQPAFPDA